MALIHKQWKNKKISGEFRMRVDFDSIPIKQHINKLNSFFYCTTFSNYLIFSSQMGKYTNLRVALVLGGENTEQQFQEITDNPDILVATPGRLQHVVVMMEADYNPLKCVEYLVFDEADR